MGVERRRDGDDEPESGDSTDSEDAASGVRAAGESASGVHAPASRVHVRRLDVLDTLRWSWEVLGDRRELLGVALAVNLLSVITALGITRPAPAAEPEFADWVPWLSLAQFLATFVVWGAVYLTAADAVANRSRSLRDHLVAATKRLPALVATAVVTGVLVGLSLLPAVGVAAVTIGDAGDFGLGIDRVVGPVAGLLLTLALGLLGVYVFHRLLLAYPACVVDRKGPIASARASWRAATGTVGKVFVLGVAYAVVVAVVYGLASVGSNVAAGLFDGWYDVASALVSAAFNAVLLPVFALALAHLYLEGSRNR